MLDDPDPDQVAGKGVTQGEAAQRHAREISLHDVPLERDTVGSIPSHGFHPPDAQRGGSIIRTDAVHR